MDDPVLPIPGLSPFRRRRLDVKFNYGLLSSETGLSQMLDIEQRLGFTDHRVGKIKSLWNRSDDRQLCRCFALRAEHRRGALGAR